MYVTSLLLPAILTVAAVGLPASRLPSASDVPHATLFFRICPYSSASLSYDAVGTPLVRAFFTALFSTDTSVNDTPIPSFLSSPPSLAFPNLQRTLALSMNASR